MKIGDLTLYGWQFTYNPYTHRWYAFHKDDRDAYYNGTEPMNPIYSELDFDSVIEALYAGQRKDT